MPNGKLGDHPLTDIIIHDQLVFSEKADLLIKQINRLGARKQLEDLCDWFAPPSLIDLEARLQVLFESLRPKGPNNQS